MYASLFLGFINLLYIKGFSPPTARTVESDASISHAVSGDKPFLENPEQAWHSRFPGKTAPAPLQFFPVSQYGLVVDWGLALELLIDGERPVVVITTLGLVPVSGVDGKFPRFSILRMDSEEHLYWLRVEAKSSSVFIATLHGSVENVFSDSGLQNGLVVEVTRHEVLEVVLS